MYEVCDFEFRQLFWWILWLSYSNYELIWMHFMSEVVANRIQWLLPVNVNHWKETKIYNVKVFAGCWLICTAQQTLLCDDITLKMISLINNLGDWPPNWVERSPNPLHPSINEQAKGTSRIYKLTLAEPAIIVLVDWTWKSMLCHKRCTRDCGM